MHPAKLHTPAAPTLTKLPSRTQSSAPSAAPRPVLEQERAHEAFVVRLREVVCGPAAGDCCSPQPTQQEAEAGQGSKPEGVVEGAARAALLGRLAGAAGAMGFDVRVSAACAACATWCACHRFVGLRQHVAAVALWTCALWSFPGLADSHNAFQSHPILCKVLSCLAACSLAMAHIVAHCARGAPAVGWRRRWALQRPAQHWP